MVMESKSSKMIHRFFKMFKFNQRLAKEIASPTFGKKPHSKLSRHLIKLYNIETYIVNQQKMYVWHGKKRGNEPVIFYIHGGAFVKRQNALHFDLFKMLVSRTGCVLIAPDYPLVPHAKADDIYEHLALSFEKARTLFKDRDMILMGDSAGGGLALGLSMQLYEDKGLNNQKLILISPWFDLSMADSMIVDIQKEDPILNYDTLQKIGKLYKGSHLIDDPMINPLMGSLEGIKHIAVWSGTFDILYVDALKLEEKAKKEDVKIDMHIYKKMLHTWIYFGIPESKHAINEICDTIQNMSEVKQ
jgi:acetyl esterase/lipase